MVIIFYVKSPFLIKFKKNCCASRKKTENAGNRRRQSGCYAEGVFLFPIG